MTPHTDVVVIGCGMIGAAVAWRCAQRGLTVTAIDPDPTRGAWYAAAGMLAPITELHYTETSLLRLSLDSLSRYPSFAAELSDATGIDTGFRECGTVFAAWDGADLAAVRDLHEFSVTLGLNSLLLSGAELRKLEPGLASGIPGGVYTPDDHQVDPRRLHAALVSAGQRAGVASIRDSAAVVLRGDSAAGVRLAGGDLISATTTVIAAGAWSAVVGGVAPHVCPPVRPVKGATLRLHLRSDTRVGHVLRGLVKGNPVYAVPRHDGELVIGASSEEAGFDQTPRAGAIYELLRDAQALLPELSEASFDQVTTRLRPGSPDNAPLIGEAGPGGLICATGHYRNGVLLAPLTADAVAELVVSGSPPECIRDFAPTRFRPVVPA
ncbi:MAG: glycine oxidase ThiO [Actinomycetota bacterium]|nr:glycine oxidase ThiO [Actinomycetota bacterium]